MTKRKRNPLKGLNSLAICGRESRTTSQRRHNWQQSTSDPNHAHSCGGTSARGTSHRHRCHWTAPWVRGRVLSPPWFLSSCMNESKWVTPDDCLVINQFILRIKARKIIKQTNKSKLHLRWGSDGLSQLVWKSDLGGIQGPRIPLYTLLSTDSKFLF